MASGLWVKLCLHQRQHLEYGLKYGLNTSSCVYTSAVILIYTIRSNHDHGDHGSVQSQMQRLHL